MARMVSRKQAVEELVAVLSDAQKEEPRLVPFIRGLWLLCREKQRPQTEGKNEGRFWPPERMPIHTKEWKKLKGGRTDLPGTKGYIAYREWMMRRKHGRRPLLERVERGGTEVTVDPRSGTRTTKPVVGVWRVNLPLCEGDPWNEVLARLEAIRDRRAVQDDGLNTRQIAVIRECVAAAWMQRLPCRHAVRVAQIIETAKMAAYHALLRSGREATVCPLWPDRKGVDLAVWHGAEDAAPSLRSCTQRPDLLVVVGKGDGRFADVLRRFDRADNGGKAERIYLAVRTPKPGFDQQGRLNGVSVLRVAGAARQGLRLQFPKRER